MAEPGKNTLVWFVALIGVAALVIWNIHSGYVAKSITFLDLFTLEFEARGQPGDASTGSGAGTANMPSSGAGRGTGPGEGAWIIGNPSGSWSGAITGKSREWTYESTLNLEPDGSFNWFFQDRMVFVHGWGTYRWGTTSSADAWVDFAFRGCVPPDRIPPDVCQRFSRTHLLTAVDRNTVRFGTIDATMRRASR